MLLGGKCWYTDKGEQRSKGLFLMIFDNIGASKSRELRAVVRDVSLSQCGHFMMGRIQINFKRNDWWTQQGHPKNGSQLQVLSGTYGNDGLPIGINRGHVPGFWESLIPVPDDLTEKFWKSEDSEGPAMRDWAMSEMRLTGDLMSGAGNNGVLVPKDFIS